MLVEFLLSRRFSWKRMFLHTFLFGLFVLSCCFLSLDLYCSSLFPFFSIQVHWYKKPFCWLLSQQMVFWHLYYNWHFIGDFMIVPFSLDRWFVCAQINPIYFVDKHSHIHSIIDNKLLTEIDWTIRENENWNRFSRYSISAIIHNGLVYSRRQQQNVYYACNLWTFYRIDERRLVWLCYTDVRL